MAQVINGLFPKTSLKEAKKDDKRVASYVLHIYIAFSDPLIWRRIQVPGDFTLSQLHEVIQRGMGWSGAHVHQFLVGKICYEPTLNPAALREAKRFDEHRYKLHTLEDDMGFLFTYLYSAGEGWEHLIDLEEVVPPTRELKHPVIMAGEGACPPENVADIHEYQALLAARTSPGSKHHDRLYELTGRPDFDPDFFDLEAAKKRLCPAT